MVWLLNFVDWAKLYIKELSCLWYSVIYKTVNIHILDFYPTFTLLELPLFSHTKYSRNNLHIIYNVVKSVTNNYNSSKEENNKITVT